MGLVHQRRETVLYEDEKVVLVGDTPDHPPLLLADPPVSHRLPHGKAGHDGQEGHEERQCPCRQAERCTPGEEELEFYFLNISIVNFY